MEYVSRNLGALNGKGVFSWISRPSLLGNGLALPLFLCWRWREKGPGEGAASVTLCNFCLSSLFATVHKCYLPISHVGTAELLRLDSQSWSPGPFRRPCLCSPAPWGGPVVPLRSRTPNHNHFRALGLHAPWFRADRVWPRCQHILHRVTVPTWEGWAMQSTLLGVETLASLLACPILTGPSLTSRGCSSPGLLPWPFSRADSDFCRDEALPLSFCLSPCLQIQPGTSAQPDQIFIPSSAAWVAGQGHRRLSALSDCEATWVCGKAGPQHHCLSEEGSGWGSRGRRAPTAGFRWGSRCEGWPRAALSTPGLLPSLLGRLFWGRTANPSSPRPCPVL